MDCRELPSTQTLCPNFRKKPTKSRDFDIVILGPLRQELVYSSKFWMPKNIFEKGEPKCQTTGGKCA